MATLVIIVSFIAAVARSLLPASQGADNEARKVEASPSSSQVTLPSLLARCPACRSIARAGDIGATGGL